MVETKGPTGPVHGPPPSLWPLGFAIGLTVTLVGLVIGSWSTAAVGAVLLVAFGFVWLRDVATGATGAPVVDVDVDEGPGPESATIGPSRRADVGGPALPAMDEEEVASYPRSKFLEGATLGLGGVITGLVAVPAAGFAIAPAFVGQKREEIDLGPIENFPEGEFAIATFLSKPEEGEVSRRTAYIRYNGTKDGEPSFTVLSNRCAHLGCPVQVNGLAMDDQKQTVERRNDPPVEITPVTATSGFGCPCHGAQYDTEGNRTAGPPVRGLDRYRFAIRNGRLVLLKPFSVARVEGAGADARIKAYALTNPGVHVEGPVSWLYPFEPPSG